MENNKQEILFDVKTFDLKLETDWLGRNFTYLDESVSTNLYAQELKDRERKNGMVILAEKQFEGKGRQGRTWYSEKGMNLTFSILLTDKELLAASPTHLNLATAVALSSTLETLFFLKTEVKWPNDVLVAGRKIAGILIETSISGDKMTKMIIGIGLNVNQGDFRGSESFNLPPTSIFSETKQPAEREKLLADFLNNYESVLLKTLAKPEYILNQWRNKCRHFGERIQVIQGDTILDGVCEDIDADGNLILREKDKSTTIYFGEVSIKV